MTLLDLENMVYSWLREPEYIGANGGRSTSPSNAQFGLAALDRDLNNALAVFLASTGFAPAVSDKVVTVRLPAAPTMDFLLPSDLVSLRRAEYVTYGSQPEVLVPATFEEFDEITAGGVNLGAAGTPRYYRVPFGTQGAYTIRLWPAPTVGNATQGDTIVLYYASNGTALVAATDVPAIPVQHHEALACYVLARYWRIKNDPDQASAYLQDFTNHVRIAKALGDEVNAVRQPSFADDESSANDFSIDGAW